MKIDDVLLTDPGLGMIASVLGTIWTLFRGSEWLQSRRAQRYQRAVDALEAGVERTYQTYVATIKAAREDGKLTRAEKARARRLAREAAIEFGQTEGIDVARELGRSFIDMWLSRIVQEKKTTG